MFDRYTIHSKRAIYFARLEAIHRGKPDIGAGDLLLGLLWDSGSRANKIADLPGMNLELRAALGIPHLPITAIPYKTQKNIPLDKAGKMTLAYAAMEADLDRQFWLDTDHLLRGLMRFENAAAEVLGRRGITLNKLRGDSFRYRWISPPEAAPRLNLRQTLRQVLNRDASRIALILAGLLIALLVLLTLGDLH